ncbi:hypothetical protein [Kocuria sp.]|uniref:hypothetical protein n=1 Tax=Kocuria sp. TaxID=1871328 RepID=UPI0026DFCD4A|nr:hypothetical protein [Kocuria sp.]MDO5619287.1 hypothetical protein [Kocuria sp.]
MKVELPQVQAENINPSRAKFEIPLCGDWLNSNQRLHWAPKANLVRRWRSAAYFVGRNAKAAFTEQVDIVAVVHKRKTTTRYDPHNLMPTVKPAIDGLVQAGVLTDDDTKAVRRVSIEAGSPDQLRPGLTLIITTVGGTEQEEQA